MDKFSKFILSCGALLLIGSGAYILGALWKQEFNWIPFGAVPMVLGTYLVVYAGKYELAVRKLAPSDDRRGLETPAGEQVQAAISLIRAVTENQVAFQQNVENLQAASAQTTFYQALHDFITALPQLYGNIDAPAVEGARKGERSQKVGT